MTDNVHSRPHNGNHPCRGDGWATAMAGTVEKWNGSPADLGEENVCQFDPNIKGNRMPNWAHCVLSAPHIMKP